MLGLMSFSSAERARLVALFHELGPDAPTLCEGWTTRDLAAHLWVRENRPDAAAGMFVPALAGRLDNAMAQAKGRDFDELVDAWGRGASKYNPLRYADSKVNFAEHYVHLEDVRRANGQTTPRDFSDVVSDEMYSTLGMLAKRMLSKSAQPVALFAAGYPRILVADKHGVAANGGAVVRVSGTVGELILWTYGRDAAEVTIEGDASAIHRASL